MIDTDYLIIGAGAMGRAFADTILNETDDATITMVDRHSRCAWQQSNGSSRRSACRLGD